VFNLISSIIFVSIIILYEQIYLLFLNQNKTKETFIIKLKTHFYRNNDVKYNVKNSNKHH
jgi:Ni,Fe-hydrogenase I cytochrome b subunit